MLTFLIATALFGAFIGGGLIMSKAQGQQQADLRRKWYDITFPSQMSDKDIQAFIRSIGKNLRSRNKLGGVPTVVFGISASAEKGITHTLGVPTDAAAYLVGQLQNALQGVDVTELPEKEDPGFQFGVTIGMQNSSEELPLASVADFSHRILASMQDAVKEHDYVVVQWIIAHSDDQKMPPSDKPIISTRGGWLRAVLGTEKAGHDEVDARRKKQVDQVYIAIGRIGAKGEDVKRAEQLVNQVERAITSEGGNAHFVTHESNHHDISKSIKHGITPLRMTAQLNVTELSAVIGWPMGDTYVPGLHRGTTRHMPVPESVPRLGRVLGKSTMPGLDRQVALSYEPEHPGASSPTVFHTFVAGQTGTGKSVFLENLGRQDMDYKAGLVVIERDGNLFNKLLNQVPPDRVQDVICVDLTQDRYPLGLNLLRTNKPEIVAGQLAALLDALYPDSKSIYANQLVQHGIPVLANLERATIMDLIPLVQPRNPAEKAWALDAVSKAPDRIYREYWKNWYKQDDKKITNDSQALKNRLWELLTPEPIRYLVNQESSSFDPQDVINGNKLLFVNLAGVSEQAAGLIGTMLVTAIWTAAKKGSPVKPNYMYLDEFQQFSHLSADFEEMLGTARKRNLGLVMATQYIERLPRTLQDAVMSNARTKVIFQSSSNSARVHASDFASQHVKPESFMNLKAYDALARVMTYQGLSEPITIHTFPEPQGYNHGARILSMSSRNYGRTKPRIDQDDSTRRVVRRVDAEENPVTFGPTDYEPPEYSL